jgi:all-trans-retinol dehydrogenase (NAD+)
MCRVVFDLIALFFATIWYTLAACFCCFIPRPCRPGWRKNLKEEIALVTGGGAGIGKLISLRLSKLGATVVIWDVNVQGECAFAFSLCI